MKTLSSISGEEYDFIVRRIVAQQAIDRQLLLDDSRVHADIEQNLISIVLDIATQEEDIKEVPADWFSHFRLQVFPRWLKKKFPPKMVWVVAVHKFPELTLPSNVLGREFVHLKVVDKLPSSP